jgi:glycerate-2-kinase
VSAALSAVDARRAVMRALAGLSDTLAREPRIRVVAAGKAALAMVQAADDQLGDRISAGVATVASAQPAHGRWRFIAATHPRPGAESEAAGRAALALADQTRAEHGLLLVLLSGGASSMLAVPADGLTIADKSAANAVLLRSGVDIGALNLVRKHMSAIKGGQLAARARRSVTLAISDVCTPVEDDPAVIGSGPTAGDDTTFADALAVITSRHLESDMPPSVLRHLQAGAAGLAAGPVRADDVRLSEAAYWIVASRHDAMRAARETAARLGYHAQIVGPPTIGEARAAAGPLVRAASGLARPACLIASGETTVEVRGHGRGGRNQELALAALEPLSALGPAALASIGTDGIDGPTDAAGALVSGEMWQALGPEAGAAVERALHENDSYPVLDRLGALVRSGPSGTNVGDLQVVLLP